MWHVVEEMTLSSNRILKSGSFSINRDNKVIIDVMPVVELPVEDKTDKYITKDLPEPADQEEAARNIIHEAKRQADDIISKAQSQAMDEKQAILKEAETVAENLKTEARKQGYEKGLNDSLNEANTIKAAANKELEDAKTWRRKMEEKLEPEMMEMILGITAKLLDNAVKINPGVIVNLVKQGLASATITGDVVVYVSKHDIEEVQARKDEILALTDGSVNVEIVKDLSLNSMDCVIETPFGNIDSSLGQQFEQLRSNLIYILNNNQSPQL